MNITRIIKSFYMGRNMTKHLKKNVGDIPKKKDSEKIMPLEFFQRYFQNTVFGINKALGSDGTMNASGAYYVMALNIQDPNHNVGYDFVEYIIDSIHKEITATQQGELKDFKFHHYSLIMHLILFKNVDIFDQSFFESTQE